MEYRIIDLPIPLGNHAGFSKKELREYYKWYIEVMPDRIGQLIQMVKNTSGYEDWEADYTPESLGRLTYWLRGQVEIRQMSQNEIDAFEESVPEIFKDIVPIETQDITDKTYSLAFDMGVYVGEVMVKNNKQLYWELILHGGKKYIDYGQVAISGFRGKSTIDPVSVSTGIAHDVLYNTIDTRTIEDLYYIWIEALKETTEDII